MRWCPKIVFHKETPNSNLLIKAPIDRASINNDFEKYTVRDIILRK